jgi:hypothetical protein
LALGVIAVLIAVPVYMLFIRDDGGSKAPSTSELVQAVRDPAKAAQVLEQRIGDQAQGIEVRYPADWRGRLDQGTVRVNSVDDDTILSVAAKAKASQSQALFAVAVKGVAADLKGAKVRYSAKPAPIAGLRAAQAVITGTQKGEPRTALVAVARGKKHAYLVTVLSPGGGDAGVANLILVRGLTLSG